MISTIFKNELIDLEKSKKRQLVTNKPLEN